MNKLDTFTTELYSPDDICKILKIGKAKCLKLFHSDEFPSQNIGRKFLITKDAFLSYLNTKHIIEKEDLISQIKSS